MSKFLKALAKVGLVELDEAERSKLAKEPAAEELSQEDISRILADARNIGGDERKTADPPPPPPAAPYDSGVGEGRELNAIYQEMRVPSSPFPAEKLLKLLDGLRAMEDRKSVV